MAKKNRAVSRPPKRKASTDLRKLAKVYASNLGRIKAWGYSQHSDFGDDDPLTIVIDKRAKNRKELEIFLHEALHLALPGLTEEKVLKAAAYQAKILWALGYRLDADKARIEIEYVKEHELPSRKG